MKPNTSNNDEHETNEKILRFYQSDNINKKDALLMDTARNNFKQGYSEALDDVKKIIDNWGFVEVGHSALVSELKQEIAKLKENK